MILAGTGHRAQDCEPEEVVRIKIATALRYSGADTVISGMANGFDLWLGDEALNLDIPLWCAKPWTGHAPRKGDEELYQKLLDNADQIINVTESDTYPGPWVYHKRNEWMVDNATHVLAYLNPEKKSGGTFACRNYAKKVGRPVRNIYTAAPF